MQIKDLENKEQRISELYKIVDRKQDKIPFQFNRAQRHFDENRAERNIILKSRRLGFTTYECLDMLDDVLFTHNFEGLLIAHKQEEAFKIFDRKIHYAWQNFDEELKKAFWTVDTNRTNELKFNFSGGDASSISVSNSGRSGTYNRVHISEFAKLCKEFPQRATEVITGTIPAVPTDGRVDIESTAEGEEGLFYDMFQEAWERGDPKFPTEYKAHFYNWTWDDEELEQVTEEQIKEFINSKDYEQQFADLKGTFKWYGDKFELSERQLTYYYTKWLSLNKKFYKLFQEYPTTVEEAFATSGSKLFDRNSIEKQVEQEGTKIGDWTIYEGYKKNHRYAGGADVGHGVGRDSSTIVIMNFSYTLPKVVAEYSSNQIDASVFAHEIAEGGKAYGNCLMCPENNDRGYATCVELNKIYNKIHVRTVEGKIDLQESKDLGWHTNASTKPRMMIDLKTAYNEELIQVPSKRINREAKTYDENDLEVIRFDEEQTKHWDLLTALAICWQMRTQHQSGTIHLPDTDKTPISPHISAQDTVPSPETSKWILQDKNQDWRITP